MDEVIGISDGNINIQTPQFTWLIYMSHGASYLIPKFLSYFGANMETCLQVILKYFYSQSPWKDIFSLQHRYLFQIQPQKNIKFIFFSSDEKILFDRNSLFFG